MNSTRRMLLKSIAAALAVPALPMGHRPAAAKALLANNAVDVLDEDDPGEYAVSYGAALAICRTPDMDILARAIYLIENANGSGNLVFQDTKNVPQGMLSRTSPNQIPMSGCAEISIRLTPEMLQQVRDGLFSTLPPWVD